MNSSYKLSFDFGCSFTNYRWISWSDVIAYDASQKHYKGSRSGTGLKYLWFQLTGVLSKSGRRKFLGDSNAKYSDCLFMIQLPSVTRSDVLYSPREALADWSAMGDWHFIADPHMFFPEEIYGKDKMIWVLDHVCETQTYLKLVIDKICELKSEADVIVVNTDRWDCSFNERMYGDTQKEMLDFYMDDVRQNPSEVYSYASEFNTRMLAFDQVMEDVGADATTYVKEHTDNYLTYMQDWIQSDLANQNYTTVLWSIDPHPSPLCAKDFANYVWDKQNKSLSDETLVWAQENHTNVLKDFEDFLHQDGDIDRVKDDYNTELRFEFHERFMADSDKFEFLRWPLP